jgi:glycosyltransferase involved in cell wall biosynthesis
VDSTIDYEVIVVNDGSSDESLSLINRFIDGHPKHNIRVFTQENLGSAQARNFAMGIAQGRYLFFCDSDDQIELGNILSEVNSDSGFDICVGNWTNSKAIGDPPYSSSKCILDYDFSHGFNHDDRKKLVGRKGYWASIYSRSFLEKGHILFLPTFRQAGGFFVLDDLFFLFQVYSGDPRIVYVNKVFYRYTRSLDGKDLQYFRQLELQPRAARIYRKHISIFPLNVRINATNFALDRMIASYKLTKSRIGFVEKLDWGISIIEFFGNLPWKKGVFLLLRVLKMWVARS